MPILKVGGKIVRVGGKLVKYPTEQVWYPVVMVNYPAGIAMCRRSNYREYYAGAVTDPNMLIDGGYVSEAVNAVYGTYTVENIPIGYSATTPISVCTHSAGYKDRVYTYFWTTASNRVSFSSYSAAVAYAVARGYPAMLNKWDVAGTQWETVSGYSNPVTPWVRHMYKLTTTSWEWWSDNSIGYANEDVSLVCVNEPRDGWSQSTSSQSSYDMNLGDEENPNWITVYYGTRYCYEYLGLMSFSDGVAEAGASLETLQSVYPLDGMSFLSAFGCGISMDYYSISGQLEMTCPSPAAHLVLTGQLQFVDSRGCALAPILECPVTAPASATYVIYDANENSIASGSLSLNGGSGFAIRLNPSLESSIDTIKFLFTLDESDRTFNSFTYKVNSVKINNTPTLKLDGTYDYSMTIPSTHSLGTIEIQRRYIIKTQ